MVLRLIILDFDKQLLDLSIFRLVLKLSRASCSMITKSLNKKLSAFNWKLAAILNFKLKMMLTINNYVSELKSMPRKININTVNH